jgi:hypothetical protein
MRPGYRGTFPSAWSASPSWKTTPNNSAAAWTLQRKISGVPGVLLMADDQKWPEPTLIDNNQCKLVEEPELLRRGASRTPMRLWQRARCCPPKQT